MRITLRMSEDGDWYARYGAGARTGNVLDVAAAHKWFVCAWDIRKEFGFDPAAHAPAAFTFEVTKTKPRQPKHVFELKLPTGNMYPEGILWRATKGAKRELPYMLMYTRESLRELYDRGYRYVRLARVVHAGSLEA